MTCPRALLRLCASSLVVAALAGCGESTPEGSCAPGEELGPDGRCRSAAACPPGEELAGASCAPPRCAAGEVDTADGCVPAGLPPDRACEPGEVAAAAGCVAAGIAPDGCHPGFVHDGDGGCEPILPPDRCPDGTMAVPGDRACAPPGSECGAGTWGDIPVEANTEFVDATFVGASDGSAAAPWTTIQEAVAAAEEGAIVAVGAGSYSGRVEVFAKHVRLWGRCPTMVEIVAPAGATTTFAVLVADGTPGTEIRDVALTAAGPYGVGLALRNSASVRLEGAFVHGAFIGVFVDANSGPADVTVVGTLFEDNDTHAGLNGESLRVERSHLRNAVSAGFAAVVPPPRPLAELALEASLVEDNGGAGVACFGCRGTVTASVIRGTRTSGQPGSVDDGFGIAASPFQVAVEDFGEPSELTVAGCYVADNETVGVAFQGGTGLLEDTVVRDTIPYSVSGRGGHGVSITSIDEPEGRAADVIVRRALVAHNTANGVTIGGSTALLEAVRVEGTVPVPAGPDAGVLGVGIQARSAPRQAQLPDVTIRGSVVRGNANAGILALDAPLVVEATLVSDTVSDAQGVGFGIFAASQLVPLAPITVSGTVAERNLGAGVMLWGVDATIEASVVRDTDLLADGQGSGIMISHGASASQDPAQALLRGVLVERSANAGISAFDAAVHIDGVVVRDTAPDDAGSFGDAVQIQSLLHPASATIVGLLAENSARAAISTFGAEVSYERVTLLCQSFDLDFEPSGAHEPRFDDRAFNACGCGAARQECLILSADLDAFPPIGGGLAP